MEEVDRMINDFAVTYEEINQVQNMYNHENKKDNTIIIGTTGVGKTTLVKILFTDNTKLQSVNTFDDSDEYIIKDDENEICSEMSSKTITPKVYTVDNMIYYDCPGFSDNRSSLSDISGAVFIKQVIDNTDRVRIMIIVNYSSVTYGNDKITFLSLIKQIIEFVKNIETVKNSIIFAINKIHKYLDDVDLAKDHILLKEIRHFLTDVKNFLIGKLINVSEQDRDMFQQQINFIDILLNNENRIIFFKRPNRAGVVENISVIQRNKTAAITALAQTSFVDVRKTDIGFTISDSTKLYIFELIKKIEDSIRADINSIIDDILEYYQSKIQIINNIEKVIEVLDGYNQELSDLITNTLTAKISSDSVSHIIRYLKTLSIQNNSHVLKKIILKYEYIRLLELLHTNMTDTKSFTWTQELNVVLCQINELLLNFKNLKDFRDKLQEYHTFSLFKDVESTDDVSTIVMDIIKTNIPYFSSMLNAIKNNDCLNKHFGNVVKEMFNEDVQLENNKIIVKGSYLCLSKINVNNETKELIIYAVHAFFIDDDLHKGSLTKVVIISPKWEVVGKHEFNLKGNPGFNWKGNLGYPEKAVRAHGKPGGPGASGCSFMGIAKFVLNAGNLQIDISGGDGGVGQDGGDGDTGEDAKVSIPDYDMSFEDGLDVIKRNKYRIIDEDSQEELNPLLWLTLKRMTHETVTYYIYGRDGNPGTDGYMAGKGGIGGAPGDCILFIETQENGIITVRRENGNEGQSGQPGRGGIGGENGKIFTLKYKKENIYFLYFLPLKLNNVHRWGVTNVEERGRAEEGKINVKLNEEGILLPADKYIIEDQQELVKDYKEYVSTVYVNTIFLTYIEKQIPDIAL